MSSSPISPLTRDALEIWKAGVAAVDSSRLVQQKIQVQPDLIQIGSTQWKPEPDSRICVVGAGKAGAGMARGLEAVLGEKWLSRTSGWINVPDDCLSPLQRIHLHGARPAGLNEPTLAGVEGTREILRRVSNLRPHDLCIVLLSGGGSALLPAPIDGISLGEKQEVTRLLMRQGATISELNTVRRHLSSIKGGGLLRACQARLMVTLIISDVIGDPLETIASGPTIVDPETPECALRVLQHFASQHGAVFPQNVMMKLQQDTGISTKTPTTQVTSAVNLVIGNNQTAVRAASEHARQLGYVIALEEFDQAGEAATAGRNFATRLLQQSSESTAKICMVSGGETTVRLAQANGEQKGGRNQEFALAAAAEWLTISPVQASLVSGGTDGEDGPTDAAGAFVDDPLLARVKNADLSPVPYLQTNNSYRFFEQFDGLIKTGPTHTNVMDLRVGLCHRNEILPHQAPSAASR